MKKSFIILFMVLALGLTMGANQAAAQVTSLADDNTYGTLRYEIAAAPNGGTVTFSISGTIALNPSNGHISIAKNLTIQGPADKDITISGIGQTRIFYISSGVVTMSDLVMISGKASNGIEGTSSSVDGTGGENGGAIYNSGDLTLTNCDFTSCVAGNGGDGYTGLSGGTGGSGIRGGKSENGASGGPGVPGDVSGNGGTGGTGAPGGYRNPTGYYGGVGGVGGAGETGQNGSNGGKGGSGGAIYNHTGATLHASVCSFTSNIAGKGGVGGQGGNGGNGGDGGIGGQGGQGATDGKGGAGGQGGQGGNGGNGGIGGGGGNGGCGGAIANNGGHVYAQNCVYSGNLYGEKGLGYQGGSAGIKGSGGQGGQAGTPSGGGTAVDDGANGANGTDGHGGTESGYVGSNGSDGSGNNGCGGYGDGLLAELAYFKATATEDGVALEWKTISETDNASFFIWRSDSKDGEYEQITSQIAALGNAWGGLVYKDTDRDAEAGTKYYYKLEAMDRNGESEFFGPAAVK